MIRDTLTTFASAVASGDAGTRQVGDSIDTFAMGPTTNVGTNVGGQRDIGSGQNVRVVGTVDETYAGSATVVTFSVVSADTPGLTSAVTHLTFSPTVTQLIAGFQFANAVLPTEGVAYKRYLGLSETVVGTTTAGKVSVGLQLDDRSTKTYAQGDVAF